MAKKDILYIFASLLLGFWLCFGSLNVVYGAIPDQLIANTTSTITNGGAQRIFWYQTLFNQSGNITSVTVRIKKNLDAGGNYFRCQFSGAISALNSNVLGFTTWADSPTYSLGSFSNGSINDLTYTFTPAFNPADHASTSLLCGITDQSGFSNSWGGAGAYNIDMFGSDNAGSYDGGAFFGVSSQPPTSADPVKDLYMDFDTGNSIDITLPADNQTLDDFLSWNVSYTATTTGDIVVEYSSVSSSTFEFSESPTPTFATGTQVIGIAKSRYLVVPIFPDPIKWYARARYIVASTTILTSPVISFYINPTPVSFTLPTSTNLTATSTCIFGDSAFSQGACGFFFAVFVPPTSTVMLFTSLKDVLIAKPPLGYFSLVVDDLSQLSEGTSTYAILSASATIALSPLFSPVRNSIYSLLWLSFAMWLLIKFRNFEP